MRPFDDATRRNIAAACAAFTRLPENGEASVLKRAAVVVALTRAREGGETAFLLTRRASHLRAHRGQWALPGGRCDAGETPVEAALRELDEELNLKLGVGEVLGLLDDYPTRSGYLITPVVVWAADGAAIRPNPGEVASVHRIALATIERAEAFDFVAIPESTRRVIRFHQQERLIHAPTAALIYQFREVLAGRQTRVTDLEQPVFAWK
ncbi:MULTISPECIES: CoA pyrophosphatase [unclassified Bradyrhizobium]|uniref:NUDIX hydrolase n=1 Tax=unclassified Bradyrhizobium TaxID=2631580 RepID=UPI0024797B25|nr:MULTISPECIES: CoA pyrophosphatase [unclassified Bradyrhizobium]WGR72172.1 CoA pyrophosphatase [Bradyrhizobium sp. ISRA426]WGR77006.1 CoA pyrophosphatase [Bradyrhizobium sp. ISRA430]WGR87411.1 CoA pyrophosphatase [Bradyrhizobium sp. ISRA432]